MFNIISQETTVLFCNTKSLCYQHLDPQERYICKTCLSYFGRPTKHYLCMMKCQSEALLLSPCNSDLTFKQRILCSALTH